MEALACAHCGLPIRRRAAGSAPAYCCLGCAILASVLGGSGRREEAGIRIVRALVLRLGLAAFFSANAMVLSLFLYSLEQPGAPAAPPAALALTRWLLLCLSAPAFLVLIPPYAAGFLRDLRQKRFSMDSLIALGAGAAFGFSTASVVRGTGAVYFDTATMVLLLVTAGRLLEANAKRRGRRAVEELMELQPPLARVFRDGQWLDQDAASIREGELVQVLAGERIPADGVIREGTSAVDESTLTGESMPVFKSAGETARAGSLCLDGTLVVRSTGASGETLLARMIASVEEAQQLRSPTQRLADRAAALLVPFTVGLAALVTLSWWHAGPEKAWMAGLSVLVVACPCALGIAVPLANVLALGAAAKRGILVRSAEALEDLAGVRAVAFDKTGTLTTGRVEVTAVVPADPFDERSLLEAAAAAALGSRHPVSQAISQLAWQRRIHPAPASGLRTFPGLGVEARLADGRAVRLGQPSWVESRIEGVPEGWRTRVEAQMQPSSGVAWCAVDGRPAGAFLVEDPVSEEAQEAVDACRRLGLRVALLSGDRAQAVESAAAALGIERAEGGLAPQEKAARLRAMESSGLGAAMVGDGINDAPALAAARVGMAVSGSADVAREVAEIVLLEGGARKVPLVIELARRTLRIARQNLAWTLAYNAAALALAATGNLRPIWAALLMLASSILVIANSVRVPASKNFAIPTNLSGSGTGP